MLQFRPARLYKPHNRIDEKFIAFHHENPKVWKLFVRFTSEAMDSGRKNYSADAVLHRIRWYTEIETYNNGGFKIGNNNSACYSRVFRRTYPEHKKFFRICARRTSV